jgi:hypothetical protein
MHGIHVEAPKNSTENWYLCSSTGARFSGEVGEIGSFRRSNFKKGNLQFSRDFSRGARESFMSKEGSSGVISIGHVMPTCSSSSPALTQQGSNLNPGNLNPFRKKPSAASKQPFQYLKFSRTLGSSTPTSPNIHHFCSLKFRII